MAAGPGGCAGFQVDGSPIFSQTGPWVAGVERAETLQSWLPEGRRVGGRPSCVLRLRGMAGGDRLPGTGPPDKGGGGSSAASFERWRGARGWDGLSGGGWLACSRHWGKPGG